MRYYRIIYLTPEGILQGKWWPLKQAPEDDPDLNQHLLSSFEDGAQDAIDIEIR